ESFAKEHGVELVDQKYFFTQERWDALQKTKAAEKAGGTGDKKFIITDQDLHGTVGAVALDRNGNLTAATSTGGKTNKLSGRIGGMIVIDKNGKIALPFNTSGMYRGYVDPNGKFVTEIYR